MKKYIVSAIAILLISIGTLLLLSYLGIFAGGSGGLQVTANIKSKVYLNNKYIADTPFCKCKKEDTIKKGDYDIKIVPEDKNFAPFFYKIRVEKGVLTVVERTFLPGSFASAMILTLEKTNSNNPQLLVTSIPEGVMVSLDGTPSGVTPFLTKEIALSEHEVELNKEGFAKKTIKIKAIPGYKLVANLILGTKNKNETNILPSVTPDKTASGSSKTKSISVKIKSTPNGFLRVRKEPSIAANEITRVEPGDTYPYIKEEDGWFQIKLADGQKGWVSVDYTERIGE